MRHGRPMTLDFARLSRMSGPWPIKKHGYRDERHYALPRGSFHRSRAQSSVFGRLNVPCGVDTRVETSFPG
jgi:hypothetical protein